MGTKRKERVLLVSSSRRGWKRRKRSRWSSATAIDWLTATCEERGTSEINVITSQKINVSKEWAGERRPFVGGCKCGSQLGRHLATGGDGGQTYRLHLWCLTLSLPSVISQSVRQLSRESKGQRTKNGKNSVFYVSIEQLQRQKCDCVI